MGRVRSNVILYNFFTFKTNVFSIIKPCFSILFFCCLFSFCYSGIAQTKYNSFRLQQLQTFQNTQNLYIQKYILKTNTFSFQFFQYFSIWYLFQYPQRNENTLKPPKNPTKSILFHNFSARSQNKPS